MNSIVEQCIASINDIKNTDFETEMDICESVIESYSKTLHLLEYYNYRDADVASLSILECEPLRVLITEAEQPQSVTPAPTNNQQQQQTATENNQVSNASANTTEEKKDNEKLWQADFRKTKDDGKKEHIIISILAFIPRLLWAIITFIGRWIKSLFKGKDKAKASEKNIAAALNETGNPEEAANAMNEWLKTKQIELAQRMQNTDVKPFTIQIKPHLQSTVKDDDGASTVLLFPPYDMKKMLNMLKQTHSTCITAAIEMFQEFKSGKTDKINEIDKKTEDIKKLKEAAIADNKLAQTLLDLQASQQKPDVSYNGVSTTEYALSYSAVTVILDQTSKLYTIMEEDVKKMNILVQELQASSAQNTALTSINETGMTKIKEYTEEIKGAVSGIQALMNKCLDVVNGSLSTINDIEKALQDPQQKQSMFGPSMAWINRTNSQNTSGAQPVANNAQQQQQPTTPVQPANQPPAQPASPTPAANSNTQPTAPTPTQAAPTPEANRVSKPSLKERASSAFNNVKTFVNAKRSKLDPKILRQLPPVYQGTFDEAVQHGYVKSEEEWKSERNRQYNSILSRQTLAGTVNQNQPREQTNMFGESTVEFVLSFEEIVQEFELLDAGETVLVSEQD